MVNSELDLVMLMCSSVSASLMLLLLSAVIALVCILRRLRMSVKTKYAYQAVACITSTAPLFIKAVFFCCSTWKIPKVRLLNHYLPVTEYSELTRQAIVSRMWPSLLLLKIPKQLPMSRTRLLTMTRPASMTAAIPTVAW